MSGLVSHLSERERRIARHRGLHAIELLMAHPAEVHYSQGPDRWEGIAHQLHAYRGDYPRHGDCSSTATWILWNAIWLPYHVHDVVNGADWRAGYTGTMASHGVRIRRGHEQILDLHLYGRGPTYEHVTVDIGGGRCFSHGSEGGPYILPIDYRPDRAQTRRYV